MVESGLEGRGIVWWDGVETPLWFIDSRQDDILVSSHDECFQGAEPRPAINLSGGNISMKYS